jgi:hypothetical protein
MDTSSQAGCCKLATFMWGLVDKLGCRQGPSMAVWHVMRWETRSVCGAVPCLCAPSAQLWYIYSELFWPAQRATFWAAWLRLAQSPGIGEGFLRSRHFFVSVCCWPSLLHGNDPSICVLFAALQAFCKALAHSLDVLHQRQCTPKVRQAPQLCAPNRLLQWTLLCQSLKALAGL